MKLAADFLLVVMVAAAWLGAFGFARLRGALDRVHCLTFVNAVCGGTLLLASVLDDGLTDRVAKILLIVGLNLVAGSAVSHVTGRMIMQRNERA